ncbi:hypothetical protein ABW19_dt0202887 [Dactylella cylindrospora]|nr:hypothetical protein ABW19_dt0202887 [Dactylella cylindrospora]
MPLIWPLRSRELPRPHLKSRLNDVRLGTRRVFPDPKNLKTQLGRENCISPGHMTACGKIFSFSSEWSGQSRRAEAALLSRLSLRAASWRTFPGEAAGGVAVPPLFFILFFSLKMEFYHRSFVKLALQHLLSLRSISRSMGVSC